MTFNSVILILTILLTFKLNAKPLVVTTLPEFAYLITQIAQDKVAVKSLLVGSENPHYLDVRPDFISTLRKADLLCFGGLELEVGWLPKSIEKSANRKLKPDSAGWCDIGSQINALDKVTTPIDRSMGDVHAAGNPHYNISIKQARLSLNFLAEKLTLLVPEEKQLFLRNKEILDKRLQKIDELVTKNFEKLKQKNNGQLKISQYHKEFSYMLRDYGILELSSVEEKPGISPSAGRIQNVARQLKNEAANLVIATDDAPISTLQKIKETAGINYAVLPRGFNKERNIDSYEKLYSEILKNLTKSMNK